MEKLRPGSIKAYIHALHHFNLFLLSVNTIVEVNEQEIYKCQAKLKNWLKHIQESLKKRAWQKEEEDLDKLLTPKEFKAFDKALAVLEEKEILTLFKIASKKINRADYNTVRDFLITSLTIDNAPQSGVLASVTINALRKAERKGDTMQVTILDHTTFESSGPANLCMQLETYRFLDTFVQKMRKQRVEAEEDAPYTDDVFITWNAQEMTSGTISGGLSLFWNKVTGHSTNGPLIRKSIVSIIHAQNPAMKSDLALHNKQKKCKTRLAARLPLMEVMAGRIAAANRPLVLAAADRCVCATFCDRSTSKQSHGRTTNLPSQKISTDSQQHA